MINHKKTARQIIFETEDILDKNDYNEALLKEWLPVDEVRKEIEDIYNVYFETRNYEEECKKDNDLYGYGILFALRNLSSHLGLLDENERQGSSTRLEHTNHKPEIRSSNTPPASSSYILLKDADFSLVEIKNTPHCKIHGAMNKITADGIWRCVSSVGSILNPHRKAGELPRYSENDCKAGCQEEKRKVE